MLRNQENSFIFISVKQYFCAICLCLASVYSLCQDTTRTTSNISGTVIAEGMPLELAAVGLLKTPFASITDSAGHFEIKNIPSGKYQLRVSFVGYENFQTEVLIPQSPNNFSVELIPLTSKLKELVVTGSLKEVQKLQSVTPVDVYTAKYFLRNPATNVFESLWNINGLFPDIDNGVTNTADVQINGLEGNYSMILIDGVPAMSGIAGIYALNALPMNVIDKIEILKGASSTLYGSEAIAGVINIKTKTPSRTPKFYTNVMLTSMLEANADISVSFKMKRASSFFTFGSESFNYRWDINGDNFMDIPLVNRANFYNKWSFTRKDNRLANIYARYLFEDRLGGQKDLPRRTTGSDKYYSEWIRTHQWQAGFQYQLPVKEKFLFMADFSEHRQNAYYGLNYYKGTQRTGFAQFTWDKKPNETNEVLFGVSYRVYHYADNTGLSEDTVTGTGKLSHIVAAFAEDEFTIKDVHKLLLGVRVDYTTRNGPIPAPRINYKWNSYDEKNVVRAGVGTGYRIPNLLNEGFGVLSGSRKVVVAEKLRAEFAISGNAGYTRVQNLKGGVLNIDVSGFYTYFFNFVNPEYSEPGLVIYNNNKNGATAAGFSLNADFTFNYPLKVGFACTYAYVFEVEKNDDGEKEREIPLHSPPFMANFYLSYNFPVPQLSIDWTGNLVSSMLLSTVPNDFRSEKSPWYSIQNIQLTKKFKNGLEIYTGLKNIFNFIQKDPLLRPFDPFNRQTNIDNPNNYVFDNTYGFTSTQGIKGFAGLRYTLQ